MTLVFVRRTAKTALLAGEMLVLAWLFITEDLSQFGFLILAIGVTLATVAIVCSDWPIGCVVMLAIGAAMPMFNATVFGLHVRPEHIATSVAIVAIVVQLSRRQVDLNLRLRNFDYWLIAYVGLNFFSSLVTSPQPSKTLVWATLNALVVTPYFLVRVLVRNDRQVWLALKGLLCVGALEAIYGILASISNHIWGTSWGVEVGQYGSIPGTYGTQYEANLFGSYTACTAVMFLALFLLSKEPRRSWYGWGVMFGLVAAFFSLARSVLLGLPIPIFALFWISAKKGHVRLRQLLPVAIGVGLVLAMLSPFVLEYVKARFATIQTGELSTDLAADSSTFGRLIQMSAALDDVKEHPIFGSGTASFQLLFKMSDVLPVSYEDEDTGWISNSPLRVVHDTGLVGLAVFLAFLGFLARTTYTALAFANRSTKVSIVALSAGLLLYAITFQATEATLLTFTWIHLGLLAAAATVASDGGRLVQSAQE
ncbi:MAG: O-antigen ligase family protein [Terriglobales bacterium]|jgi:O-antigen ligase/polysaccharide polymerase Wzy-like membrane protein